MICLIQKLSKMVLRLFNEAFVVAFSALFLFMSLKSEYSHVTFTAPLLQTVNGTVGYENFTYWKLSRVGDYDGPLIIELISHGGDADLYVSTNDRPSFEVDRNDFSSATCGIDEVRIPEDYPRPLTIGIYGHSVSELSIYTLHIYYDIITATDNLKAKLNSGWGSSIVHPEELHLQQQLQNQQLNDGENADGSKVKVYLRDLPEQNGVWKKTSKLMGLLGLVDTIFELFFL